MGPYTVADPGFSPGGGANSQKCYYFSIFCRKLHENERIWTPRGGRASLAPPLGSANDIDFMFLATPPPHPATGSDAELLRGVPWHNHKHRENVMLNHVNTYCIH